MIANTQNPTELINYMQLKQLSYSETLTVNEFLKSSLVMHSYDNIKNVIKAYLASGNDPNFLDSGLIKNYSDVR